MDKEINLYLCEPRSFCFGVMKAIDIVNEALNEYGCPVYILNEIVHNKHVVQSLKNKGAVFVEDLHNADESRPLIFSAHGVSNTIEEEARKNFSIVIDATCPLVKKVHKKVKELDKDNYNIIIIGKEKHPEIIGTKGQVSSHSNVFVVNSIEEANNLSISGIVGYVTQTTLSIDETKDIINTLKQKFPNIGSLDKSDICFATTQRQLAVKNVVKFVDIVIVVGSKNSSNSNKLKEIAISNGAKDAILIDDVSELNWDIIDKYKNIGITAGASAPEYLILEIIEAFKKRYEKINIQSVNI